MAHADGNKRWMLCRATADRDAMGVATRLAGSLADISELKAAQDRLYELAHHDQLTGLPNRRVFTDKIRHALAQQKREHGVGFAVLFGDFDGFKLVNDTLGHSVGDAMLIRASECFRENLSSKDTIARFGGDEFAILLRDISSDEDAKRIANRLIDVFNSPYNLQGHEVRSTLSLGLVMGRMEYETADEIMRDADAAMYQAKATGKSRCQVFDENMHKAAMTRLDTERELSKLTKDYRFMDREFRLLYQPLVDLSSAKIVGFEALVRWQHPEKGMIPPDVFIPVAEDSGSIIQLGEWILRRSCEQMVKWRQKYNLAEPFTMSINVSRRQLCHQSFCDSLERVIKETGVAAEDIQLELTETTVMDQRVDAIEIMNRCRDLGVKLAMDDFGAGQSSLSCLRQFPLHTLKIDREFLINMTQEREFCAVMHAIVMLAHNLDLHVVAEGIETEAQLVQLQSMDCACGQGYYFSRPVDAEQAEGMLGDSYKSWGYAA